MTCLNFNLVWWYPNTIMGHFSRPNFPKDGSNASCLQSHLQDRDPWIKSFWGAIRRVSASPFEHLEFIFDEVNLMLQFLNVSRSKELFIQWAVSEQKVRPTTRARGWLARLAADRKGPAGRTPMMYTRRHNLYIRLTIYHYNTPLTIRR